PGFKVETVENPDGVQFKQRSVQPGSTRPAGTGLFSS
ncbi:MAG: hypothetical protein QOI53_3757, partial [Verrucomicrobiota bacterium]|nr:hypothetical protein [Verrucomicrobiota bacterium]